MNKVILMGRLTSDPEIRYTQNKLAWMQRADELEIKIYACECLLDKAYEHWEDFEVDGENKNEH